MEKKRLEELREMLMVVDMVNGFIREGKMKDNYIEHIIPENLRLIKLFLENKLGLIFIKDSHEEDCAEFLKFPKHCVKGTNEANLVTELRSYESEGIVYLKNSTSAIFAPHFLDDIGIMKKLERIIITGCCTDICVSNLAIPLQNYFDQNNRRVEIIVPTNAVETYDAPYHDRDIYNEMAFKVMEQVGIKLVKKYK